MVLCFLDEHPREDWNMNAIAKLDARWQAGGRICVGLDSDFELLPELFRNNGPYSGMRSFNTAIIRHTKDLALAYKMNLADYIAEGPSGINALVDTFAFIRREAPDVLTILDCKFGDALSEKNAKYARFAFEVCKADAMTAQVYAGGDAAEGFTRHADKLIFFLCTTSNHGSSDFQRLLLDTGQFPLYHIVARKVSDRWTWNKEGNCGLVVGATRPTDVSKVRTIVGEMPILAPGIGKQDGEFAETVRAGVIRNKGRLIVNESRSIIFAEYDKHAQKHNDSLTFAKAARQRLLERTAEYNRILEPEAA